MSRENGRAQATLVSMESSEADEFIRERELGEKYSIEYLSIFAMREGVEKVIIARTPLPLPEGKDPECIWEFWTSEGWKEDPRPRRKFDPIPQS